MGRFVKEKVKTVPQRFDALIERAQFFCGKSETDNFVMALKKMKSQNDTVVIKPVDLCLDVLEEILFDNTVDFDKRTDYYKVLTDAEKMYKEIFVFDEETPDYELLRLIFIEMFTKNNVYRNRMFDIQLFNSFDNKRKYLAMCQAIIAEPNGRKTFEAVKQYGLQIREYMLNDDMFAANLVKVAIKLLRNVEKLDGDVSSNENIQKIIAEEIKDIKRMNGIYDIDAINVVTIEEDIAKAELAIKQGVDILSQVESKTQAAHRIAERFETSVKEVSDREISLIESRIATLKREVDAVIQEYIDTQKKAILSEKDVLVKQVYAQAQVELDKYKAMAQTITSSAAIELAALNSESERVLSRITQMVNDDEQVKKIISQAKADQEFIEKVNKLSLLSDKNIEVMGRQLERAAAAEATAATKPAEAPKKAPVVNEQDGMSAAAAANFTAGTNAQYVVNTGDMYIGEFHEEDREIRPVNPLLDPSIPFTKRFEVVKKEKARRMEAGEHFHQMFDDVLIAVMENANPYMIGPSGCGKTFMVKQIASLLNMEFIDIGYINEEYEILGFQTATGKYSRPNFYRCYKYGMIAFCDELDNGNSRATVKLNSFLSNNLDSSYSFPNGETVQRHANFRIIAAGNTEGNGADENYNTREKIEESVQQRFVPMYIDYDNQVEKSILKNYPAWFSFVVLFRHATNAWEKNNGSTAQGILTTRDAQRIRQYLDDKSFDLHQIIKYEFIQTKDTEYLAFLEANISKNIEKYPESKAIFESFSRQVNEIRMKGRH